MASTELFNANLASTNVLAGGTDAPPSGTSETWTVASSAAFGVAVTGVSVFHVADPALNTEVIRVTNVNGNTWTVVRGAENTTPLAHAAGFNVYQIVTTGFLTSPSFAGTVTAPSFTSTGAGGTILPADLPGPGYWLNIVTQYGADPTGTNVSTTAIQNALNAVGGTSGVVYVPPGTYFSGPLNVSSGTRIIGDGELSIIKMIPSGPNNNLLLMQSVTQVHISDLVLDGNISNQSNNSYGMYFGACTDCSATRVRTQNWNGDGTQLYNCSRVSMVSCWSTGNLYHGFEIEQCTNCSLANCFGYGNTTHGLIFTPGEVAGTGSVGNSVTGGAFSGNSQYGICVNSDNGGASSHLSEGNKIIGTSVTGNTQYGICLFQEDKTVIEGCYIENNGYFGLYGFETSYNQVTGNFFHNNSQAGNGSYDEILFEGNNSGHASTYNTISGNTILIDGTNKARYAINEGSSGDGPNVIIGNEIPASGTSGYIHSLCATDVFVTSAGVFGNLVSTPRSTLDDGSGNANIAGNATASTLQVTNTGGAIPGSLAGLDAAFSGILRIYNNFTSGSTQIVAPNGNAQFWVGGVNSTNITAAGVDVVTAGCGLRVIEGSSCKQGIGTLASGALIVANTVVTSTSRIFMTHQSTSGTPGALYVSGRTAATGFAVGSTSGSDNGVFAYEIFEPG